MPRGAIAFPGRASSPLLALPTLYANSWRNSGFSVHSFLKTFPQTQLDRRNRDRRSEIVQAQKNFAGGNGKNWNTYQCSGR